MINRDKGKLKNQIKFQYRSAFLRSLWRNSSQKKKSKDKNKKPTNQKLENPFKNNPNDINLHFKNCIREIESPIKTTVNPYTQIKWYWEDKRKRERIKYKIKVTRGDFLLMENFFLFRKENQFSFPFIFFSKNKIKQTTRKHLVDTKFHRFAGNKISFLSILNVNISFW